MEKRRSESLENSDQHRHRARYRQFVLWRTSTSLPRARRSFWGRFQAVARSIRQQWIADTRPASRTLALKCGYPSVAPERPNLANIKILHMKAGNRVSSEVVQRSTPVSRVSVCGSNFGEWRTRNCPCSPRAARRWSENIHRIHWRGRRATEGRRRGTLAE